MSIINVLVDFYSDWIEILRKELISFGFSVKPDEDKQTISFRYFNLRKRMVDPLPRIILVSKEFSCPIEIENGLNLLKEKIEKGHNLTPHLSTRITDLDYNDTLLNDWGIHHLHLGTEIDDRGFIKRTDPLLFARFDEKNAYLINVMPHGSWTKQKIIKIIHDNWPESIEHYRLKGVLGLSYKPTDDEINMLRKANISTMVEIEEGLIYAPIGGGYMTCGISTDVVIKSNRYARIFRNLEQYLKENINEILKGFKDIEIKDKELEFHIELKDNEFYAVNKKYMIAVKYGNF